jgi:hypothetical protein
MAAAEICHASATQAEPWADGRDSLFFKGAIDSQLNKVNL